MFGVIHNIKSKCFFYWIFTAFSTPVSEISLFSLFLLSILGAFLVPYILMVFVIGLPIFFAELFVGQYSGLGPIIAYKRLAPFFHGKYSIFF